MRLYFSNGTQVRLYLNKIKIKIFSEMCNALDCPSSRISTSVLILFSLTRTCNVIYKLLLKESNLSFGIVLCLSAVQNNKKF